MPVSRLSMIGLINGMDIKIMLKLTWKQEVMANLKLLNDGSVASDAAWRYTRRRTMIGIILGSLINVGSRSQKRKTSHRNLIPKASITGAFVARRSWTSYNRYTGRMAVERSIRISITPNAYQNALCLIISSDLVIDELGYGTDLVKALTCKNSPWMR